MIGAIAGDIIGSIYEGKYAEGCGIGFVESLIFNWQWNHNENESIVPCPVIGSFLFVGKLFPQNSNSSLYKIGW